MRRLVGAKSYSDVIVSEDLFSPIIEVFRENQGRYNLLDSAIIELFESIQGSDFIDLMNYTLQKFGDYLEQIDYVDTFKTLKNMRDALIENENKKDKDFSIINEYVTNDVDLEREEDEVSLGRLMKKFRGE